MAQVTSFTIQAITQGQDGQSINVQVSFSDGTSTTFAAASDATQADLSARIKGFIANKNRTDTLVTNAQALVGQTFPYP